MVEAMRLKTKEPRSPSMAWLPCWISWKSASWFKSY